MDQQIIMCPSCHCTLPRSLAVNSVNRNVTKQRAAKLEFQIKQRTFQRKKSWYRGMLGKMISISFVLGVGADIYPKKYSTYNFCSKLIFFFYFFSRFSDSWKSKQPIIDDYNLCVFQFIFYKYIWFALLSFFEAEPTSFCGGILAARGRNFSRFLNETFFFHSWKTVLPAISIGKNLLLLNRFFLVNGDATTVN